MIRLYWVVQHPTGRLILRDDVVEVLGLDVDRLVYKIRFADGFSQTEIPVADVVKALPVEVGS